MPVTPAEAQIWSRDLDTKKINLTDAEINAKYERGEGRIVVENNREKLPGFVEQLQNKDYMDLRPFYQRRPRWEIQRQSRLIESFLINLPVPPVFLYEKDFNSYEVMDGQQRITAIRDFYENKYALKGLQHWPELDGRFYHNLPKTVKAGIDRRSISSIVMLRESAPQDEEALLLRQIVFERLNTGGVELERQEIRNALFQGPLNDLIMKLSSHNAIRDTWGLPRFDPEEIKKRDASLLTSTFFQKMEDAELVLRFFALRNSDHYTRGMQGFLDVYMMRASSLDSDTMEDMEADFLLSIETAEAIYGEYLFKPYEITKKQWATRPQKAFYDAVMVGISDNIHLSDRLIEKRKAVLAATAKLFQSHEDGTFTGRGNSKADILNRIALFSKMLREIGE